MRRLIALLVFVFVSLPALGDVAPPVPLNDTGQTQCLNAAGNALEACDATNTDDSANSPRQDARFGRDAAAAAGVLTKTGGGAAGFDFTRICNSGDAVGTGACPANPSLGSDANDWACTRDNVTGLIWEVKTDDNGLRDKDWTYTWFNGTTGTPDGTNNCNPNTRCDTDKFVADVNTAGLCGFSSGWRLPTRRELLSIVHLGASSPAIDTAYFPNTVSNWYWSGDLYTPNPAGAWSVHFYDGNALAYDHDYGYHVRLVRGGQ
ncbi:DUF1566 domain-containing protein [Thiobaca trueperi]|uniref:Uncharacterized protein DUF1566 n=1 Tax=Thiobaca trueperi TaxID=127458 RepID=A0A4R3MYL1_9GAMM|nr:DUF1566 domain-containing protein [Thiobaca trueperi]TCT19843.1 uncharacterized protein DUF1566 [Thiobaca trueperi]